MIMIVDRVKNVKLVRVYYRQAGKILKMNVRI